MLAKNFAQIRIDKDSQLHALGRKVEQRNTRERIYERQRDRD